MLVCSNQVQKSTKVLRLFLRHRETALEKVYLTAFTALHLFCAFLLVALEKVLLGSDVSFFLRESICEKVG